MSAEYNFLLSLLLTQSPSIHLSDNPIAWYCGDTPDKEIDMNQLIARLAGDAFNNNGEHEPSIFTVEGCKVLFSNRTSWIGAFDPQDLSRALTYEEYSKRTDTVRAKNWAAVLAYLTK
jgi:hypothetical protein